MKRRFKVSKKRLQDCRIFEKEDPVYEKLRLFMFAVAMPFYFLVAFSIMLIGKMELLECFALFSGSGALIFTSAMIRPGTKGFWIVLAASLGFIIFYIFIYPFVYDQIIHF